MVVVVVVVVEVEAAAAAAAAAMLHIREYRNNAAKVYACIMPYHE